MPHEFAQTNIQLYNQMLESGYPESDVILARQSYEAAVPLFASRMRSNGKPFVAHLIGTASILAWMKQNGPLIAAGLLHAAYMQGDFRDGRTGSTPARRSRLSRLIGSEAEKLIHAYTGFSWSVEAVEEYASRCSDFSEPKRNLLRIRLANDLEDNLDLGMLFSAKGVRREDRGTEFEKRCVDLAEELGHPQLGDALRKAFDTTRSATVPTSLARTESVSFEVEPQGGSVRRAARRFLRRH